MHPQGYDSFGLPAEQYAIQTGRHPLETTNENISRYREQLDRLGFSFDWSREIRTSNKKIGPAAVTVYAFKRAYLSLCPNCSAANF